MKQWNPAAYGAEIERLLTMAGGGGRLIPLTVQPCASEAARKEISSRSAAQWFPDAQVPEGALTGLYFYFSCFDQAHGTAQAIETVDGSYWHAILHRQEPDASNARYWFQRVGKHPVFPRLLAEAQEIANVHKEAAWTPPAAWSPDAFIDLCEDASRQPGSKVETLALELQRAEWQLLFDHCARSRA
jgi:hypothetical protein